jgi:hypothetical protein
MLCKGCGQLIKGEYVLHDGGACHSSCYAKLYAVRCAYCQRPLLGQYLIDYWGTTFCPEHKAVYPSCRFCDRLVPTQQHTQSKSPGQVRCAICRTNAVETVEQAGPIFSQLVRWFHSQGLSCNNLRLQIDLSDQQQLHDLHQQQLGHQPLGLTIHRFIPASGMRTEIERVAVLRGLPTTLFQGVAVHELGHVWLAIQVSSILPPWAEEGFCELIAHRFYTQLATRESLFHAERVARNPDPVYGEGFRRVQAIAQSVGYQRLLDTLRTTRRMPNMS